MTSDFNNIENQKFFSDNGKLTIEMSAKEKAAYQEFRSKYFPAAKTVTCRSCNKQLNKKNRARVETNSWVNNKLVKKIKYPPYCEADYKHVLASRRTHMIIESRSLSDVPRSILEVGEQMPPSGNMDSGAIKDVKQRIAKPTAKIEVTQEDYEGYKQYVKEKNRGVKRYMPDENGNLVEMKDED